MTMRRALAFGVLALGIAACGAVARSQEKYRLRETAQVGQTSDVDFTSDVSVKLEVTAAGTGTEIVDLAQRDHDKYTERILSVGPEGYPTATRRYYQTARRFVTNPITKDKITTMKRQGHVVTLRRANGKTVASMDEGTIPAVERAELESHLSGSDSGPFPDREVSVGDEWTIDSPKLAKAVGFDKKAVLTGRLAEIATYEGHRCAHVELSLEAEGSPESAAGAEIHMTVTGDVYYALDLQQTISVSLTGPVKATGSMLYRGVKLTLVGEGTATFKTTSNVKLPGSGT